MEIEKFEIDGPLLIKLKAFHDNRGFFVERFNKEKFQSLGLNINFVQDNFSRSAYGVLRGLHYQFNPAQGKLVTCTRGEFFDVVVDIRKGSKTFGKSITLKLSGDRPEAFWIPAGFAHGFCVTSTEGADILYKVDNYWNPKGEGCLLWNDPDLAIPWPIENPILSEKDLAGVMLKETNIAVDAVKN